MVKIPETDEEARRQRRLAEEAKIAANMEAERARNLARLETAKRLESFNPPVLGAPPIRSGARYEEPDLTAGSPEPERRYIPPVDDPARDAPGIAQSPAWDPSLAIPAAQDGSGIFGVGSGGPEDPVPGPLSEAQIIQLREWKDNRDAGVQSFEMRKRLMDGADPEAAAKALELSQRTGASRLEVQSDPEGYSRLDLMSQVDKLRETSPRTLTWLNAYPDNFDIAHDDTESLSWWEGVSKSFGDAFARTDALKAECGRRDGAGMGALTEYPLASDLRPGVADAQGVAYGAAVTGGALKSGFATTTSGIYGVARSASELNDQFASWVAGRKLESVPSQWLAERQQAAKISADEWMPKVEDPTLQGALQGIQSLPTSALTIAMGIMTGGASAPIMGAAVAGGVTAGDEYGTAREQGMDPLSSAGYGATQGILEAAWEVPQLHFLIGDINQLTPFGEMLFKQALVQVITEQGAAHTQNFVSWALLPSNEGKTIDDYLAEMPAAAYQTLIASMVGTGVQTTTAKLLNEGLKAIDEGYAQKRAEEIARFVDKSIENGANSKLLKRNLPDKYREAVAAVSDVSYRVDSEAFNELAQEQGVSVAQLAQAFRIDPAEAQSAIDGGQEVVIPAGNYVAGIQTAKKEIGVGGEAIHAALGPNIRLKPGDPTLREREIDRAIAETMEAQQEDPGFADAADRVREDSRQTLAATGRFNAETTAVQSAIPAELIITLAERTNQDPEKLWGDYKASVESKIKADEDELSQGGDRAPMEVDDDTLQRASERLTEYEFAVWKAATLEGRSNSEIADDPAIEELRLKQYITRSEKDAMPGRENISVILNRARNKGFSAPEAKRGRGDAIKDDVKRLVKLGLTSKQIHERLGRPAELRNSTNAQVSKIKKEMREAGELAQDQTENRGGFTGMNLSQEAVIRLYETATLDTFIHETAHWYLTTLEKMARLDNPQPFVIEQLASIRNWGGKHPEFEIYDASGQITPEGKVLHEQFAEAFSVYFIDGKAPSTAMRSVFATFKQWLLRVYDAVIKGIPRAIRDVVWDVGPYTRQRIAAKERELGRALRDDEIIDFVVSPEIREVFNRALATDEAIAAARKGMDMNAERMAKALVDKMDPDGKWTPERREKELAKLTRLLPEARERAESAMRATAIDQYFRTEKVWWREDWRDTERDVTSEIDERPEQRAYQVFTGEGWRDTLEDHVERAAAQEELFSLNPRSFKAIREASPEDLAAWFDEKVVSVTTKGRGTLLRLSSEINGEQARDIEIKFSETSRDGFNGFTVDMMFEGRLAGVEPSSPKAAREGLAVFNRTVAAIKEHMRRTKPDYVVFTGSGEEQSKLYDFLVRSFSFEGYEGRIEHYASDLIVNDASVFGISDTKVFTLAREDIATQLPINLENPVVQDGQTPGGFRQVSKRYNWTEIVQPPARSAGAPDGGRDQSGGTDAGRDAGAQGELGQERSLPMDEASRMQRAREMGFDVDTPLYHGTNKDFEAFDMGQAGTGMSIGDKGERAIFLTDSPAVADSYLAGAYVNRDAPKIIEKNAQGADMGNGVGRYYNDDSAVYPVFVRGLDKFDEWDFGGGGYTPADIRKVIQTAKKDKLRGVVINNIRDPGIMDATGPVGSPRKPGRLVIVFNPKDIRGKFAAFDPSQEGSSKLLAHTRTRPGRTAPPPSIPPMRLDLRAVEEQYGPEALAALPPKVRAHSASATDADQFVALARDVQATLKKKVPRSLSKFLSNKRTIGEGNDKITYSGIRDPDGEILAMIGKRGEARGLIATPENDSKKSRSYSYEEAIQAAYDAGYFRGEAVPTIAEFLDILRGDVDGTAKLYRADDIPVLQQIEDAEANAAWFDQMEIDITEENDAVLRAAIEVKLSGQGTNAIGPDEAAERLSAALKTNAFPDGNALLQALKEGPKRDKLIREETRRRMIERHGDIFNDGTIMQAATEAARNEIQYRQDEIELEALAVAAGQQAAKNLARETAKELLRDKQVREVLNYNQWLLLEQRWMKKAVEAAEKGKTDKALEYKRYAMINGAMFKEASKLAEKIEKTRKHLLDYTSRTKRSRLLEAGRDYLDQMTGLLDDYQFRPESKKGEAKRASRAVWLQTQMAGLDPFAAYADPTKSAQEQMAAAAEAIERSAMLARLADGVDAKNYKSITVEELLAVRDEADLIYRLATLKDRLIKEGERRRLSLAAGDIVASVSANQPKARPPEPMESNLPGEKFKRAVSGFMVSHRTFQALARQFDGGKEGGVFWRYIVRPLNDAFARKTTLMKRAGKDVEKLFSVFAPSELARFMRDRQTISLVAEDGTTEKVSLTTQGRIAVALNAGNEKNLARLMDSNGWDRKQVQAILDTLSKKEMDFVQATWDYLETWFAEADRVHQSVHGVPMDKQEPKQLATRHGVYAGGYFPIAFDPHRSSKSGQRKLEQDAQAAGGGRIGVRQEAGFAKKRVSGRVTLPLNLDPFAVILRHLDQVTTSIATEEVLFDVGRLIKRPEVEQIIVERHGRVKYDEIIESVKAAKFGLPVAQGSVEKVLNHVRNGSTVAKLGWSVSTAMLQPSGISNSIVRIGFPWMMRGYARMLGGAAQMEGWAKWAMERSEFMRNRRENQSPEQVNLLATLKGNKPLVMVQRSAFQLMAQVQFFSVDLATWYGAFDKAVAGGADEALAVSMADQAVLDAQGGGEAFQTAGIQRGSVGVRLLTNLMSYMLTTYQLSVQSFANKDPNIIAKVARISADMVLLWSVPVAATMAIRYAIQVAISGDDDDEEYWSLENISREQASFLMSPYFGLSQIAGAVKTDPYTYRGPAGLDMLVQTYKATEAASHGDVEELLRPLNQMAGMAFHLPANQIDKSVRGSIALWNGETDSLLALFFGPPPK